MFDFSWSELALIGVVALVVIGPKDLPKALRTAGVWVRKARTISREFQSSVEQMMREAELDEVKKQIESVSSVNIEKEIDPSGEPTEALKPPEMPDLNKIGNDPAPPPVSAAEPAASPAPQLQSDEPPPLVPGSASPVPVSGEPASSETSKTDPAKTEPSKSDLPTSAGAP